MRDSFGGAFMLKLSMFFLIIFISILSIALTFSKSFRVKNGIINRLEQYQYNGSADDLAIGVIETYLEEVSYNYNYDSLREDCRLQSIDGTSFVFTDHGVCIIPRGEDESRYYKVFTYIPIKFPFFGLNYHIAITGETKIIY